MKKSLILKFGLTATLLASAFAIASTINDNTVKLGKPGSSSNKEIIFDTGNGTTNKKLQLNHSTKELSATSNDLKIGDAAASTKKITFDRGSNNPVIRWNESTSSLEFTNDGSNYTQIGSGSGGGSGLNLLSNEGFESGVSVGWTSSGGTFAAAAGANILFGNASATFDASATSQYIESTAYTVPNGLKGRACQARIFYLGGDANLKLQVLDGSSAAVAGAADLTLAVTTLPTKANIYFPCPASGSLKLRVASTANAAIVALDKMHLGEADFSDVSQASFFGGILWAKTASCDWQLTNTSYTSYSADSDCVLPTGTGLMGNASAPATKIPAISFANLPPGEYMLVATGEFQQNSSTNESYWRFFDGTSGANEENTTYSNSSGSYIGNITGRFSYSTTQSNITFSIQGKGSGVALTSISNAGANLSIRVYRFPTTQEQVFRAETLANSWSGSHGNDCSWSRTSTSYGDPTADATCTFTERTNSNFGTVISYDAAGNKLPGIVFTPSRPGKYYVCALVSATGNTLNAGLNFKFYDGTTTIAERGVNVHVTADVQAVPLCGLYNASSTSAATLRVETKASGGSVQLANSSTETSIEWSIFQIDQSMPAPVIVPNPSAIYSANFSNGSATVYWDVTSASYADFTPHSTPTLTVGLNSGFGTVAAAGSTLPGITFTSMPYTGVVRIVATAGACFTTANEASIRLVDGSNTLIKAMSYHENAANAPVHVSLIGYYSVTAGVGYTFKIQGKSATGTINCAGSTGLSDILDYSVEYVNR